MKPPRVLYKYESLATQSLANLKSQIVYFGSPLQFNDPYDCAINPSIESPSDEELDAMRNSYLKKPDLPSSARIEFETYDYPQLREIFVRSARNALNNGVQDFLKTKGVVCFTERNDDLLMWSHYGGKYKGFCLEFNTSAELFQKVKPVRYVRTIPSISVTSILNDHGSVFSDLFCTKSDAWSYEKEWRAIHKVAGTEFGYPSDALAGVYFGPDIDRQSLEIVCLILAGQNENVRLWRGSRSTSEFKVLFEEFTYTSHLDAKRKGIIK